MAAVLVYYLDDLQLFEMGAVHLNLMGSVQMVEMGAAQFVIWRMDSFLGGCWIEIVDMGDGHLFEEDTAQLFEKEAGQLLEVRVGHLFEM